MGAKLSQMKSFADHSHEEGATYPRRCAVYYDSYPDFFGRVLTVGSPKSHWFLGVVISPQSEGEGSKQGAAASNLVTVQFDERLEEGDIPMENVRFVMAQAPYLQLQNAPIFPGAASICNPPGESEPKDPTIVDNVFGNLQPTSLYLGDLVQVLYQKGNNDAWYRGRVWNLHQKAGQSLADIAYDDGDVECNVPYNPPPSEDAEHYIILLERGYTNLSWLHDCTVSLADLSPRLRQRYPFLMGTALCPPEQEVASSSADQTTVEVSYKLPSRGTSMSEKKVELFPYNDVVTAVFQYEIFRSKNCHKKHTIVDWPVEDVSKVKVKTKVKATKETAKQEATASKKATPEKVVPERNAVRPTRTTLKMESSPESETSSSFSTGPRFKTTPEEDDASSEVNDSKDDDYDEEEEAVDDESDELVVPQFSTRRRVLESPARSLRQRRARVSYKETVDDNFDDPSLIIAVRPRRTDASSRIPQHNLIEKSPSRGTKGWKREDNDGDFDINPPQRNSRGTTSTCATFTRAVSSRTGTRTRGKTGAATTNDDSEDIPPPVPVRKRQKISKLGKEEADVILESYWDWHSMLNPPTASPHDLASSSSYKIMDHSMANPLGKAMVSSDATMAADMLTFMASMHGTCLFSLVPS
jgi:hypothetical protein